MTNQDPENARLQADLAAARAALGRINEVVSPCGWTNPEDVVGRVQQRAAQRKQSDRMYQRLVDDLNADLAAARADQAAMTRDSLRALHEKMSEEVGYMLSTARTEYGEGSLASDRRWVKEVELHLAALPAQHPEPKPDAATRDGDDDWSGWPVTVTVRDGDEVLRELAQWAGREGTNELWRAVAELCRRELARGGQ